MIKWVCRAYQQVMRAAEAFLPWREPVLIEGEGSVLRLPEKLLADGVCKPLLVTGPTLRRLGAVDALCSALEHAGITPVVFDRVNNDPTIANVEEAVACYHQNGCDGIIAFGGGSPMDCAKVCGARVARPNRSVQKLKGMLKVRRALPPLYAAPTTAGTGSEVTIAAVVTDERHRKFAVGDLSLIPRVAVLDPMLTVGMPPRVTAASGMDALSHAVEAYIGHSNTKDTRANAVLATRLILENLETAYRDGANLRAREAMQHAAYRAGLAFTRANVGYVHAVAHAIGGRYGIAHGAACAAAMPPVLRAYGRFAWKPLAKLADAVGVAGENDTPEQKADCLIHTIEGMNAQLGLPTHYPQIARDDIPTLAAEAAKEGNLFYPAPKILEQAELAAILEELSGRGAGTRA